VVFEDKGLKTNNATFYVDIRAVISIIKKNKLKSRIQINIEEILAIDEITPGEFHALSQVMI
jgi:hypothetical protein